MTEAVMELRGELAPYERSIVEQAARTGAHIVLPEGTATARIGLELIRRLGPPAVVFAPGVAAQLSWQRTLSRFADPAGVLALASLDAQAGAPITLLTWDDLVGAAASADLITAVLSEHWAEELVAQGRAGDPVAAAARIERWAEHNPRKVERTLRLRRAQLTGRLLRASREEALQRLAGRIPAAVVDLGEALEAAGVKVIVLDGCDHLDAGRALLVYWLSDHLASAAGTRPMVVCLSSVARTVAGAHRYCPHLHPGPSIAAPSPPIVHAGDLLPYRDLVYFVSPTPGEAERLDHLCGQSRAARTRRRRLLSASASKATAAVELLGYEQAARPEQLCAVVLTDHEGTAAVEPGSAHAVLVRCLAADPTRPVPALLLTGTHLLAPARLAEAALASCHASLDRLDLRASCRLEDSSIPGTAVIAGEGEDWHERTLAMLTARMMRAGVASCVIGGADGALGRTWDALELDTLVDLTGRATVAGARLRGQAQRTREAPPDKVVHVWHVVTHAAEADEPEREARPPSRRDHEPEREARPPSRRDHDDPDVRRLVKEMGGRWGLPVSERGSRLVRGIAVIDHRLATGPLHAVDYRGVTARCLTQIGDREDSRRRWAPGPSPQPGFVASVEASGLVEPERGRVLTSKLRSPLLLAGLLAGLLAAAYALDWATPVRLAVQAATLGAAALLGGRARQALRILRIGRRSPEARLAARGCAVLDSLRDSGHLNLQLGADAVRVRQTEPWRFEVRLDHSSARDAQVFAAALIETLAPLNGQPYVVEAAGQIVPVPALLSSSPQVFAEHWRWYSGMGRLVSAAERPAAERPPAPLAQPSRAIPLEIWDSEWGERPPDRTPPATSR